MIFPINKWMNHLITAGEVLKHTVVDSFNDDSKSMIDMECASLINYLTNINFSSNAESFSRQCRFLFFAKITLGKKILLGLFVFDIKKDIRFCFGSSVHFSFFSKITCCCC